MKKLILSIAFVIGLISPAFSQDSGLERWAGPWLGLNGSSWNQGSGTKGSEYGIDLGYNYGIGDSGLIIGVELSQSNSTTTNVANSKNSSMSVSLVGGYAMSETIFGYVSGGRASDHKGPTYNGTYKGTKMAIGLDYALSSTVSIGADYSSTNYSNAALKTKKGFGLNLRVGF
ncbi:MAG: hypothetical protein ACI8Y9_000297 [Paracoccaceae bacterium]|jgi:hypothetical protein